MPTDGLIAGVLCPSVLHAQPVGKQIESLLVNNVPPQCLPEAQRDQMAHIRTWRLLSPAFTVVVPLMSALACTLHCAGTPSAAPTPGGVAAAPGGAGLGLAASAAGSKGSSTVSMRVR